MLAIGLVWSVFWGIPLGVAIYYRLRARRVRGTLIGFQGSEDDRRAIYRYLDTGNRPVEASLAVSGDTDNLLVGSVDFVLVSARDPQTAMRNTGYTNELVAAVGFLVGPLIIHSGYPRWSGLRVLGLSLLAPLVIGLALYIKATLESRAGNKPGEPALPSHAVPTRAGPTRYRESMQPLVRARLALAFGLVAMVFALSMALPIAQLQIRGRSAHGNVKDVTMVSTGRAGVHVNYLVEFSDSASVLQFPDGESAPATYAVGDMVTVLYFESRPRDSARIDPGIWYWARVALVALAGGIATMFGVTILRGRGGK
jgi:hypothetical protein